MKEYPIKIANRNFIILVELVRIALQYCKAQSKYKNNKVTVAYTLISNIKKDREIGSVFVKNSQYVIL